MRNVATPAPLYLRSSRRSTNHIIIIIIYSIVQQLQWSFFTVRCYAECGYATVSHLSVHMSVCPFVMFRYCGHIGWNTLKRLTQHGQPGAMEHPQN